MQSVKMVILIAALALALMFLLHLCNKREPNYSVDLVVITKGGSKKISISCEEGRRCQALYAQAKSVRWQKTGPRVACTEIYGGPEIAEVSGHIGDRSIRSSFSRTNGCEIERWTSLESFLDSSSEFSSESWKSIQKISWD